MQERVFVVEGDITQQKVDAIVNAANKSLLGGGGVDGAIHLAAGPELLEECRQIGGCPTGEARITKGYHLPARWVIHTVGPIWYGGTRHEDEFLARCYQSSLELAGQYQILTIAFPSISTGAYGFPLERAARIAIHTINRSLKDHPAIEIVYLVCFGQQAYNCYQAQLRDIESNPGGAN